MKREAITIRFDGKLLERLRVNAELSGCSFNQEINQELWLIVKRRERYLRQKASQEEKPKDINNYYNSENETQMLANNAETLASNEDEMDEETFADIFADI